MNEMVIYKNSVNAVAFPRLTGVEYDILYAILYKIRDKESNVVSITFEEMETLTEWSKPSRLAASIRSTNKKLLGANFMIALDDEGKVTSQEPLFLRFKTDENKKILEVQVNPTFVDLFNRLGQYYTSMELKAVTSFQSKYSKRLYAQLRQFRRTGWWQVDVAELRRLLDVPESFSMGMFVKKVLSPACEEISKYTRSIVTFSPIYEIRTHKQGRRPIKAFRFDFTKEVKEEADEKKTARKVTKEQRQVASKPSGNGRRNTADTVQKVISRLAQSSNVENFIYLQNEMDCFKECIKVSNHYGGKIPWEQLQSMSFDERLSELQSIFREE